MTIFEYIMVMVSIILALALAQLLRAIAELFTNPRRYWVHTLWVVILVLFVVQFWWAYWDFNVVETWTFDIYLVVLVAPILVYLEANLLVPVNRGEEYDWKSHFKNIYRWFFSFLILIIIAAIFVSVIFLDTPLLHTYRAFQVTLLALSFAGLVAQSDRAQGIVAVAYLFVFLISQAVVRMNLGALATV